MLLQNLSNKMSILIKNLQMTEKPVVLYGASDAGKNYVEILRNYNIYIECFIDDDLKKQNKTYCGINVLSREIFLKKCTGNEIILIASYSPSVIIQKIRNMAPSLYEQIRWSDFYLWENGLDYFQYYQKNMEQIDRVAGMFCDEKSRHVFENLLNYKVSRNNELIEEIRDSVNEQYFTPEIMTFTDEEIFVDLGAYSGDTIEGFSRAVNGKYGRIVAVEPDEINFKLLRENTSRYPKIEYYKAGIADRDGTARFNAVGIYTSHFDKEGGQKIKTMSVDSIMKGEKVTFIKADIEGLEIKMLKGARNIIERYKPKIAIAVYHKKEDIFEIPLLLHSYRDDYRFFMRHYTEMPIDTVLYAL